MGSVADVKQRIRVSMVYGDTDSIFLKITGLDMNTLSPNLREEIWSSLDKILESKQLLFEQEGSFLGFNILSFSMIEEIQNSLTSKVLELIQLDPRKNEIL